jgi:DNA polymerase-3 subunit delta'
MRRSPPVAGPDLSSGEPFADVPGQRQAIAELRAAVANPVHAYLLAGPPGSGKRHAARSFAAALLCPAGGCGECVDCDRALRNAHPDLLFAEREGATYLIDDIRRLTALAHRRPLEAARTVIVIPEAHLLGRNAAAFLKTLEEPPVTTVFVLLADDLPRDLETIRSRCVEIDFEPLTRETVAEWLVGHGIEPARAAELAEGAAGDVHRALLLAEDTGYASRLMLWREIPSLLDGTGATAAELAVRLNESLKEATAPLEAAQASELAELEDLAKAMGERGVPGRSKIIERHKREIRRYQTTELRAGLAVLSRTYRDLLVRGALDGREGAGTIDWSAAGAVDMIGRLARELSRNPRMPLALEHLFVSLST